MRRPSFCSVLDESYLGCDATKQDLHRFWEAFDILLHNRDMLEDRGLLCHEDPEKVPELIEEWLWNDGKIRVEEIVGE